MIDWTKPIETVPDELNPDPVPCEFVRTYSDEGSDAIILGSWKSFLGGNMGNAYFPRGWMFNRHGNPQVDWLPHIRNVAE